MKNYMLLGAFLTFVFQGFAQNTYPWPTTGNIGIGTTSPSSRLDILEAGGGSGTLSALRIRNGNNNNYFGNNQVLFSYAATTGYSHAIKTRHNSAAIPGNAIDFYVWQPGDAIGAIGSMHAMTMEGGNVGIGTTTPSSQLHIFSSSVSPFLNIEKTAISQEAGIKFSRAGNTLFYLWNDDTSDALKIQATGLTGEVDATPRMEFPLANKNIYMALSGGNVGIGTTSPDARLAVKGQVHAQEVKVDLSVPGPDYVFEKGYTLPSLESVKTYINQNKHLPEVPSAKEMEANGINLSEMNMLLLKKVEELTLYMIEQQKTNEVQTQEIQNLKRTVKDLQK